MMNDFGLYLILTNPAAGYEQAAAAAVEEGVAYLQLRMKEEPVHVIMETARKIRSLTQGTGTKFVVNDHLEVAMEVNADGLHLGQDDMSLEEARNRWAVPGKIFGLSTHNEDQEKAARSLRPDYIGVGPVFPTPTKATPDPTLGLERMERIIRSSPLTCVAIGGINKNNLNEILSHGARNFALVRDVNLSESPRKDISELMKLWREVLNGFN